MKKTIPFAILTTTLLLLTACGQTRPSSSAVESSQTPISSDVQSNNVPTSQTPSSSVAPSSSENFDDGREIRTDELYTDSGLSVKFKATGASIDKITWGTDKKQIAKDGFVVGRCANRIAGGKFSIAGTDYTVSKNDGNNSLHGGAGSGGNSWRGPFATIL